MSTLTYDTSVAATAAASPKPAAGRKGFWARMLDRFVEARMRQAMAEVRRYGIVLPRELEDTNLSAKASGRDALPFTR
jgi:hypothetical protein